MIKVYQYEHSPYCIPIVAALRAFRVEPDKVNLPYGDPRLVIELTGGAYYQVPVLMDDSNSGKIVFESSASSQDVARYVDQHYGRDRLFPPQLDGIQAIVISHLENEVEGVTFKLQDPYFIETLTDIVQKTMVIRQKERKFGRGCVQKWVKERPQLWIETEAVLTPYEKILGHSPFLLGHEPVYSDFLLYGVIGNLTFAGRNDISERFPAISTWEKRLRDFRFGEGF